MDEKLNHKIQVLLSEFDIKNLNKLIIHYADEVGRIPSISSYVRKLILDDFKNNEEKLK